MQHALHKGPLSRASFTGASVLELGSGAGLAGFAAAMLGGHVALTDVADVLPLLHDNVALNFSTAAWNAAVTLRGQFGSVVVRELDWTQPQQLAQFQERYDYIIGTDCVYHEALLLDLLRVVLHCSSSRTKGTLSLPVLRFSPEMAISFVPFVQVS